LGKFGFTTTDDTLLVDRAISLILNVSPSYVNRLMDEGKLPYSMINDRRKSRYADVMLLKKEILKKEKQDLNKSDSTEEGIFESYK